MSHTAYAVAGYIAISLALTMLIVLYRGVLVTQKKRAPNNFDPNGLDISPFSRRLARSHANCYESFGVVCGPMLLALATGMTSITEGLACVVLIARLVQAVVHLLSTHNAWVLVRATAFFVQLGIAAYWVVSLLVELASKTPVAS